jgi:transposase
MTGGVKLCYYCMLKKVKEKYPNAPKIHIILDQGPYNKSVVTKEFAQKNNIKLHFLPTYSPNLNPIERIWKLMNEYVRNNRFFSIPKEFNDAIFNFFFKTWPTIGLSLASRINDNFQTVIKPENALSAVSF